MELFCNTLFLGGAGLLLGWLVLRRILLYRKMAPGPYGVPILGSLIRLATVDNIDEFEKYKGKYGKVFSISLGDFYATVITDTKLILSCLKREEFQGRPNFDLWSLKNDGVRNRGILHADGPTHQVQRRFCVRTLRDFGFGKESMEGMLLHELKELQGVLAADAGHPVSLSGVFNASVINSLWGILTGSRFELGDPTLKQLTTLMIENFKNFDLTPPVYFFYRPIKYGLIGRKQVATLMQLLDQTKDVLRKMIREHEETLEEEGGGGEARDFVDAYLHQIRNSAPGSSFYGEEGMKNLEATLLELFIAGAETTSTTLKWAILFVSKYQAVQRRVQAEIDAVIGRARPPTRSDKAKMVFSEAVFNEIHRKAALVPFSVFHSATKDSEIGGHFVPQGSVLYFSIYDAHHDPSVWGPDPESFRPERFLSEDGSKLVKYDALIPFSAGKRQCLGEALARDTLFLFFIGLLQKFEFKLDPNSTPKELKGSRTFVSDPPPYKVIIKQRSS